MSALASLSLVSWSIDYILNSIWQIPLVFAAAWFAARLARPTGPRMEHRVWACALVVETMLPALHLNLTSLGQQIYAAITRVWDLSLGRLTSTSEVRIAVGPGSVSGSGLHLPSVLLAAIGITYASSFLYFAARLAWGLWKTNRMLRGAQPLTVAADLADRLTRQGNQSEHRLLTRYSIQVAISSIVTSPVTMGILRRVLLLPPGFLDRVTQADLDAVLAHEFAHMRRRDFAKNLFYGFLSLPIAYHPALWLTSARLAETREMVCDEMAASAVTGRENYARALLRLASMLTEPMPVRTLHAIGIFDANIFERRIMNLTKRRIELPPTRRIVIAVACVAVALAACASALAFRMEVSPAAAQTEGPKKIHVKADDLKIVTQVRPVYPVDAKKARVQGAVLLDVLIDKEGVPTNISVQSGPDGLQKSAIDAVRQWRWQPYLLNGEAIDVETTITVTYSLAG
jgi:TonB family protein